MNKIKYLEDSGWKMIVIQPTFFQRGRVLWLDPEHPEFGTSAENAIAIQEDREMEREIPNANEPPDPWVELFRKKAIARKKARSGYKNEQNQI